MSEALVAAVGALLFALLLLQFAEGVGGVIAAAFVGAARWILKRCFGIDHPRMGADSLVGKQVLAQEEFSVSDESGLPEGYVVIEGERWRARVINGRQELSPGETLSIVKREGLVLLVSQAPGE